MRLFISPISALNTRAFVLPLAGIGDMPFINELKSTIKNARRRRMSVPTIHGGGGKFRHGLLQLLIHSIDPLHEHEGESQALYPAFVSVRIDLSRFPHLSATHSTEAPVSVGRKINRELSWRGIAEEDDIQKIGVNFYQETSLS